MPVTYVQFSNITVQNVIDYLRLTEVPTSESNLLATILPAAKSFVLGYTGRDLIPASADNYPELTIAVYALCEDMYDKRSFTVNAESANQVVESILGCRSLNLL